MIPFRKGLALELGMEICFFPEAQALASKASPGATKTGFSVYFCSVALALARPSPAASAFAAPPASAAAAPDIISAHKSRLIVIRAPPPNPSNRPPNPPKELARRLEYAFNDCASATARQHDRREDGGIFGARLCSVIGGRAAPPRETESMSDSTDGAKRTASRATSFDVAALARVSQSAVSRAFTPGASIAKEKRDRVLEAARKLNYVPNSIASSLSTKRTNIVAVILGNLRNPFYVHVLEAFSQRLKALGRQILVFTVEPGADSDDAILDALRYQIDAIILTAAQISTRMTSICHQRGIPIVLFNRYIPGSDASGVRCDNVGGGRLIAEAFLAAGARSFAMITGDPRGTTSQDRVRGFVERLLEGGIRRAAIEEAPGLSSYDGAAAAVLALFERRDRPRPDALFGINDIMAMGAIDMLREIGR